MPAGGGGRIIQKRNADFMLMRMQRKNKMQSFRTEIENPLVEKDIIELEQKIRLFREGKTDPEKFRSLRLARGAVWA